MMFLGTLNPQDIIGTLWVQDALYRQRTPSRESVLIKKALMQVFNTMQVLGIEVNDGQMSGLCGVRADDLYSNLAKALLR